MAPAGARPPPRVQDQGGEVPRWDVRWFDSIDSTNRYLLDEARAGASEGVVVVAGSQSAGRGRLGRAWSARPGAALLASVLLRPDLEPDEVQLCCAVVAMSAADACERVAGVSPVLKWPNDLLVGRRKLAGVLAEAEVSGGAVKAVVVGIGLNLSPPGDVGDRWAPADLESARGAGAAKVARDEVLGALLSSLAGRYAGLRRPAGRVEQAGEYARRCSTVGQRVRVEATGGTFEGEATAVTPHGALIVVVEGAERTVAAGDVVHLGPVDRGGRRVPGPPR